MVPSGDPLHMAEIRRPAGHLEISPKDEPDRMRATRGDDALQAMRQRSLIEREKSASRAGKDVLTSSPLTRQLVSFFRLFRRMPDGGPPLRCVGRINSNRAASIP
jgi:hypothetical protein